MKRVLTEKLTENSKVAIDIYDEEGRQLLKKGVKSGQDTVKKLKKFNIPFVYVEDPEIQHSVVYGTGLISELLKVLHNFILSKGENSAIAGKYNIEEIRKIVKYNNITGSKIAYAHVFKYFMGKMADVLKPGVFYDFLDYRTVKTYLPFHSVNTAAISMLLGYNMGLGKEELIDMGAGALLSDYSMRRYDFTESRKELDSPEKEEMREHTYLSFDNIRKIYGLSSRSALVAYQHHERYNGSGYPKKLADKKIAGLSRIVSAADVYDALISKRPFRPAYRPDEAWEYIADNKGILFEPDVVSVFKKSIAKYLPGDRVLLSDGSRAGVIKNNPGNMEEPVIKIIEKKGRSDIITAAEKKGKPSIIKITESIR